MTVFIGFTDQVGTRSRQIHSGRILLGIDHVAAISLTKIERTIGIDQEALGVQSRNVLLGRSPYACGNNMRRAGIFMFDAARKMVPHT